jgi:hypothetical protein
MFVIPTYVGFTHRVVAMLVACAVVLTSIGFCTKAQAANLVEVKDTLSDSGPSVTSAHTFSFEIPVGSTLASTGTVSITFPSGFTGVTSLVTGNITVRKNGNLTTHSNFTAPSQTISFETGTSSTAGDVITVAVADGVVTNPSGIQSYEFQITTPTDTGRTRVAIVNYVEVTAIVNTVFDFVVAGLGTSTSINGTSTTGSTTATTIPFGVLAANGIYTLGQQLSVTTNARNGFVVTVEQDGNLQSSNGADIDSFANGNHTNTPATWTAPTNGLLLENEWGHWGLTSNDSDLNGGEFTSGGGNKWVAASTTPRLIFEHNGPANGITQDVGQVEVAYQVQVTPLQEAADDYSATLMYVATPTF